MKELSYQEFEKAAIKEECPLLFTIKGIYWQAFAFSPKSFLFYKLPRSIHIPLSDLVCNNIKPTKLKEIEREMREYVDKQNSCLSLLEETPERNRIDGLIGGCLVGAKIGEFVPDDEWEDSKGWRKLNVCVWNMDGDGNIVYDRIPYSETIFDGTIQQFLAIVSLFDAVNELPYLKNEAVWKNLYRK